MIEICNAKNDIHQVANAILKKLVLASQASADELTQLGNTTPQTAIRKKELYELYELANDLVKDYERKIELFESAMVEKRNERLSAAAEIEAEFIGLYPVDHDLDSMVVPV
jgi:hypothetical protein